MPSTSSRSEIEPVMSEDSGAPEIVVVGSCNIDLITYTDRFPAVGKTIARRDFKRGSSAASPAVQRLFALLPLRA